MTEPPAKRARRMDSSTMWDVSDKRPRAPHSPGPESDRDGRSRQGSSKPDGPRKNGRDDRRYRSRSRDRNERRRDRTGSRDRYDRDRDRDGGRRDRDTRGGRDRDRSTSKDRLQSRRGSYIPFTLVKFIKILSRGTSRVSLKIRQKRPVTLTSSQRHPSSFPDPASWLERRSKR
jgi:hypothetical protein